jgi:hypothetical protein
MAVLFRMLILVAKPRLSAFWLVHPGSKNWIPGNHLKTRHARDRPPKSVRKPRDGMVEPQYHHSTGLEQFGDCSKRRAGIGRVMQHSARVHHVKCTLPKAWSAKISLDEEEPLDAKAIGGVSGKLQGGPTQVRSDHQPISLRQAQAHLAGAAPDLYNSRVRGNSLIEEANEFVAEESRTDIGDGLARMVTRERRNRVEVPYLCGTLIARSA